MNPFNMQSMTGLPSGKKKTRRGGRKFGNSNKTAEARGAGANAGNVGNVVPKDSHTDHHNALNGAMKKGDHSTAKKHALALVKSLHGLTSATVGLDPMGNNTGLPSDADANTTSTTINSNPFPGAKGKSATGGKSSRLLATLRAQKKGPRM